MGIQICANQGAGPFWGSVRGQIGKILIILKNLLLKNHWLKSLILGMEHPWDKEIQICTNIVPGVIDDHAPGGQFF